MEEHEVMEVIAEKEIDFIRLQFTDILGVIKNVSIPASQIEKAFEEGIWFDGSSIDGFVRIQESDMRLDPDPDSFTLLPFEHDKENDITTARLICDVTHPDGTPFMGDPRYALKRAIKEAEEMGYEFFAGPEPEFFVFDQDEGKPTLKPQDAGGYFDLGPKDQATELRGDIIQTLDGMGFEVEASHHEVAEGQHEIDFKYEDALTTADNISTFRMVVRAIAEMHDLHATFMPKPIAGINGSGMHTHMSLFDGEDPVFYNPDNEFNFSEVAKQFMAGVIDHAKAITAVTNPTVNSYKRIIPGYEAPIYIAWSDVNRSALIRKPAAQTPTGTRFEFRSPDPSCNPYLHLAVCLMAGLDGVKRELECPDPVRENIYEFNEEKREEYDIDVLPGNLHQAIEALEADDVVLDALGPHIGDKFIEAKKSEWDDYKAYVSEWEHDRYFETF